MTRYALAAGRLIMLGDHPQACVISTALPGHTGPTLLPTELDALAHRIVDALNAQLDEEEDDAIHEDARVRLLDDANGFEAGTLATVVWRRESKHGSDFYDDIGVVFDDEPDEVHRLTVFDVEAVSEGQTND